MQTKYIKYFKKALLFTSMCIVVAGTLFTSSCKKEEGTNGVTILNSFGPCPIARGAELRFVGQNLDKVDSIILPGNIILTSTDFAVKTASLITITVPQNAVPGFITLKSSDGAITTKTELGFSEPISISSFTPALAKAQSVITINGDYLNLIKQVIFTSNVAVNQADFISQSRSQLKVKVPDAAQTGKIAISNGADNPIIIYTASNLTVTLPVITTVLPNPVKAGSALTITGTDLDLVKTLIFGGNKKVTSFTSQSTTQIIVNVPADAQDDTLKAVPASGVVVKSSAKLVMVAPTVNVTPTTVKNGADITVTGTDLDLVDHVIFGGNVNGTIKAGGTSTQILVTVPNTAVTGTANFVTKANKTVSGGTVTIVDPVFTSFSPASAKPNTTLTITGTDLDLVTSVVFTGGLNGTIAAGGTSTQLTVSVPVGAKTGKIILVAMNGSQIPSPSDFTVLVNLPNFTSFTEVKGTQGKILTINGTNMDLIKTLIFPGNIAATDYGIKSSTQVQVYVPMGVPTGMGQITMVTYEGDQGLLPSLMFGYLQPSLPTTIMVMDYEQHGGHNGYWDNSWTGSTSITAENGNTFIKTTASLNGWFMNCNHQSNGAPAPVINPIENYVLKFDIRIDAGVTGAENAALQFIFHDQWNYWYGAGLFPPTTGGEWITVSVPVSKWSLTGTLDLSSGTYGLSGGPIPAGVSIDNLRFDLK